MSGTMYFKSSSSLHVINPTPHSITHFVQHARFIVFPNYYYYLFIYLTPQSV